MSARRDDSFDEDPLESDQDSNDDVELIPCPYCGQPISDDAEKCNYCKSYIIPLDGHRTVPKWLMITIWLSLVGGAALAVLLLARIGKQMSAPHL